MDEDAQEEVKPRFSQADKIRIVSDFITQRYKIGSYAKMELILKSGEMRPLKEGFFDTQLGEPTAFIGPHQLESYFSYLVSVVSGSFRPSQATLTEAYNQLFSFLVAMDGDISISGEEGLYIRPTLESRIHNLESILSKLTQQLETISVMSNELHKLTKESESLRTELTSLRSATQSDSDKVTTILGRIEKWFKVYEPTLARAKSEYETLDKKVSKP